jgi:GrpB-like predicted nucleotidyltransferase (UPF0157 family)
MNELNNSEQFRKTNVMPYDLNWPLFYTIESKKIAALFEDNLIEIHHIGSTAVPGMAAKPVIDILVVVKDVTQLGNHKNELESLGYHWMGEYGIPGRRYLWKEGSHQIDYHLQCFERDHIGSKNTLIFRNFLIAHPDKASQYASTKVKASEKFPNDSHAYWYEKKSVVDVLLEEALCWHQNNLGPS